jgi:hypothetical protein
MVVSVVLVVLEVSVGLYGLFGTSPFWTPIS